MATLDELYPNPPKAAPVSTTFATGDDAAYVGTMDPESMMLSQVATPAPAPAVPAAPINTLDKLYPSGVAAPTVGQAAEEVAIGTAQGAARDAPMVTGGVAGARFGLATVPAVAAVSGPLAPVTTVAWPLLTTGAGLAMGYYSGQSLDKLFPAVSRDELVPYREGGKTFGSSIASAPAAFALPTLQGNRVAQFVTHLGELARRNPKTFLTAEAITSAGMGAAGGTSEAYFPGQQGTRLGFELTAGLLTPTKALTAGVDVAKNAIKSAVTFGGQRAGRMDAKAANLLIDALEKAGEDPEQIIKALRRNIPSTVPTPTAGQKTGSKALMDMEAALGEHHAQFGGELKKQGQTALKAYQLLVDQLTTIGTPEALQAVAKLRQQNFDNMLATRISKAEADAAQKILRITQDTPASRAQIGDIVKTEVELALQNARSVERDLWGEALNTALKPVLKRTYAEVPMQGRPAERIWEKTGTWPMMRIPRETNALPSLTPSSTVEAFVNRAAQVGDAVYNTTIPKPVRDIMEVFGVTQDSVSSFKKSQIRDSGPTLPKAKDVDVREMINYRSNLLDMARQAAAKGEVSDANFYSTLADAMLTDLNQIKNPAFDQARDFSRSLNDVFTRTFAKEASITGSTLSTGAEKLPAEILVRRAFGANADVTAQRMNEITDAVSFMKTRYDDAVKKFGKNSDMAKYLKPMADMATQQVASVQDAQNRVLRLLAADSVTETWDAAKQAYVQQVNVPKLNKFISQNEEMLRKLGVINDLQDATKAQNLLTQVAKENSALNNTVRKQTAFAKVLAGGENPVNVIADALSASNKTPVKSISNLAKLAKSGGPDAVGGLKSMIIDYAYTKAGGNSGRFDVDAFDRALFQPLSRNQPSLINMMRASDVMSFGEVKNLRRLITPMQRVQKALNNNVPLDDVIKDADAVTDFALRVIGAEVGTAAAVGGHSLVAAGAGSRAVRQIFEKLPNATIRQILENAAQDPEAMAILLAKGKTVKQKTDIYNNVLNYLGSMGVNVGRNAITPGLNYLAPDEPRPSQLRNPLFYKEFGDSAPFFNVPYTPQGVAARQLRFLASAPNTRGVPGLTDQTKPKAGPPKGQAPGMGAAGPEAGAPAGTSARSMLQSLWPYDTITPLIESTAK